MEVVMSWCWYVDPIAKPSIPSLRLESDSTERERERERGREGERERGRGRERESVASWGFKTTSHSLWFGSKI